MEERSKAKERILYRKDMGGDQSGYRVQMQEIYHDPAEQECKR